MNLTDTRAWVREMTDHNADDLYSDASLDRVLAAVVAELWQVGDWPFAYTETTLVTDTHGTAPLPADVRRIDTVVHTTPTGDRLVPAAPVETGWAGWARPEAGDVVAAADDVAVSGFTVVDGRLYVRPAGAVTLRVRHTSAPAVLPEAAGELPLPVEFHDGVAYGAAARILRTEGDTSGRADGFQGEYQAVVDRCRRVFLQGSRKPFKMGGRGSARVGVRR